MTKLGEIYKCEICGNMVEVVNASFGELVCCNQPMTLLEAKTEGEGDVKHVPVIDIDGDEVTIKVGEVTHPMEEEHYIQFIILSVGNEEFKKCLSPGDEPKAVFNVATNDKKVSATAYCNIHGLWSS